MALQINDTSYAGTFASYFWLPATFGMDTVQKGVVYVQDGIKKAHTIDRMDFKNPLQPREATPTSKGDFTVDGRKLTPEDLMVYTEFNPRNFESNFLAEQLSRTLLAREVPVTAENYMMQMALGRTFEQVEMGIWQGSKDFQGKYVYGDAKYQLQFFDGFMKKFLNDAAVVQASSPTALTGAATGGGKTNILEAMDALISSVALNKKAMLSNAKKYDRMKFIISVVSEQLYQTALTSGLTFKGLQTADRLTIPYKGFEVVALAGIPEDTIIFAEFLPDTSSNFYIGMNSTEDNALQLMRLQNNSELFFFKGLMKFDVQYGFSEQVFIWTTQTAADYAN
jgi:hypothetical protein